jgi:hypothetical protein
MPKINGGYYIKARCIQESEINECPPHFREIWDWLMANANHKDRKVSGRIIKRGQCFTSKKEILDGLKWKVGYRVERYKTHQYENSMKFLRSRGMITVTKTVRGIIVTIINYNKYQDPKNYESRTESRNESRTPPDGTVTINKKDKNVKNVKNIYTHYNSEINSLRKTSMRAKTNIKHYLKKYSFDVLIKSIDNYKTTLNGTDPQYRKDPANFFGKTDKYFIDYLPENFKPTKSSEVEDPDEYIFTNPTK